MDLLMVGCRQLSDSSPHHNCGTTIDIFFRQAVADSTDLQEKVKAGADLGALGKESGFEFTQEELETGWEELQESDEGLTDFELDVVSGGARGGACGS